MSIMNIKNIFFSKPKIQPNKEYGKHLIPRYLYHVTSLENYKHIRRQGVLVTNNELFMGESIFLFDMENFLKFWNIVTKKYQKLLKEALIDRIKDQNSGIVLLKIDTSKLSKPDLKIRCQDIIFNPELQEGLKRNAQKSKNGLCVYSSKVKRRFSHFFYGEDAINANLYKQRKQSIEYVYPFDILKDAYSKIGEIESDQIRSENLGFWDIMKKLLENQPEIKALEQFYNKK